MKNLLKEATKLSSASSKSSSGSSPKALTKPSTKPSTPKTTLPQVAKALLSPKTLIALLILGVAMAIMPEILYANPLMDNQITQGILSFATDVGPWLAGVSIAIGVANCGYCLFRRANCDETDTKRWNDKIKTTIICSSAAAVVTGVLPPVLNHYFGVS